MSKRAQQSCYDNIRPVPITSPNYNSFYPAPVQFNSIQAASSDNYWDKTVKKSVQYKKATDKQAAFSGLSHHCDMITYTPPLPQS